jgi:hypothetical protein
MAETVEAEVIPPSSSSATRQERRVTHDGMLKRPGVALFATGMLTGLLLGFAAVYVIKKKL